MSLGRYEEYENKDLLFDALSSIDCPRVALLLTAGANLIDRFRQIPGLVVHAAYLSEQNLQLAYSCADFLICPSPYEGDGLPILEAMACPVICAGTSSLPEMAGDAAPLIDPDRPDELVKAMSVLAQPAFRQAMIERGVRHAR
jgi:glycosyltransferase involved in cell wall biosynthesis